MAIDKLISFHIERQFPAIYRENGQELVQFVKEYYKFLETNTNQSLYNGRRIYEYRDIDTTLSRMLLFFKNKYLADMPFDEDTIRIVVKNIIGLYRRKGTQEGLELFFTLFYKETIKVYNPSKDMLKPSSSNWSTGTYFQMHPTEGIFTGTLGNKYTYADLIGKNVVGSFSKSQAIVDKINFIMLEKTILPIIYINDIRGEFVRFDRLESKINDEEIVTFGSIYGSLTDVEIDLNQRTTSGHQLGDLVDIVSESGIGGKGVVSEVNNTFTGQVDYTILDSGWGYSIGDTKLLTSTQTFIASNPELELVELETFTDENSNTCIVIGQDDISFGIRNEGNEYASGVVLTAVDRQDSNTEIVSLKIVPEGHATYTFPEAILRCSVDISPENTRFNVDIGGGRKLGDISNTGTVTSADSLEILKYIKGLEQDPDIVSYIETEFMSYVLSNPGTYGDYVAKKIEYTQLAALNDSSPGDLYPDTEDTSDVKVSELDNIEQVSLIRDFISDFLNVPLNSSNFNTNPPATSTMSGTANTITISTPLDEAFDLVPFNVGSIKSFVNIDPGENYINDTFALAVDNVTKTLSRRNQILTFPAADFTYKFEVGQLITQENGGDQITGKIVSKDEDKKSLYIMPYSYSKDFIPGNISYKSNSYSVNDVTVDFSTPKVSGYNANIDASTDFAVGRMKSIRITDSGFGYIDGAAADIVDSDGSIAAKANIVLGGSGTTGGFWSSLDSHINGYSSKSGSLEYFDSGKKIQDSDYYQEFSYEVQSKLGLERYEDLLKETVHVAGTKVHGKFNLEELVISPTESIKFAIDSGFVDTSNVESANTGFGGPNTSIISVDVTYYSVDSTAISVDTI